VKDNDGTLQVTLSITRASEDGFHKDERYLSRGNLKQVGMMIFGAAKVKLTCWEQLDRYLYHLTFTGPSVGRDVGSESGHNTNSTAAILHLYYSCMTINEL
jgi:hypothetical protein